MTARSSPAIASGSSRASASPGEVQLHAGAREGSVLGNGGEAHHHAQRGALSRSAPASRNQHHADRQHGDHPSATGRPRLCHERWGRTLPAGHLGDLRSWPTRIGRRGARLTPARNQVT